MRLVAFCEAPADFRLISGLVDRVLREAGPSWVADNLDAPEVVRTWLPDGFGREYFDIHKLDKYVSKHGVRVPHGHFDGRPGGAGALMARTVFWIARTLQRQTPDDPISSIVLVWDLDEQPDERASGVKAARDEAHCWAPFKIVCGLPDPEREAWVLAGFEPCSDAEQACLERLHRDLGFSPVMHAIRLRTKQEGHARNIKRVLSELTGDDPQREARCWGEPMLETLRARGADTGLAAFIEEIETILVPLFGR